MTMPCRNTAALARFERHDVDAEREFERKLYEFRRDPYSFCEWNIDAFSKYDLLSIALDSLLPEFDMEAAADWRENACARKDAMAAIRDSVEKIEL